MFNKVFISYAKEDVKYAEELYDFLEENSLDPWMDKKKLKLGQDWDFFIRQELRNADFIILLLSSVSISKRGYVQREFKTAVKYYEEKLKSDIYLLPIKIDNCLVPEELSQFQWHEFQSEDIYDKIIESIEHQRNVYEKNEKERQSRLLNLSYRTEVKKGVFGEKPAIIEYYLEYPVFAKLEDESIKELSVLLNYEIVNTMLECREMSKGFSELNVQDDHDFHSSTNNLVIKIEKINKRFISTTSNSSYYQSGAAHGMYGTSGANYLLNPLRYFDFYSLFESEESAKSTLIPIIYAKIRAENNDRLSIEDIDQDNYIEVEELEPISENYKNYYFTKDSIVFIFNPYEIGPYSMGSFWVQIGFNELSRIFPKEEGLKEFLKLLKEE